MGLIYQQPWTRQPQTAVGINRAAAISRGLVLLVPLGPGNSYRDISTGVQGTPTGLTSRLASALGTYPLFSNTDYVDLTLPGGINGTTPITIAFTYRQTAQTDGFPTVLAWKPTGAANQFIVVIGPTSSYHFAVGPRDGASSASDFAATAPPINVDRACLITLTGGTDSATTGTRRLWLGGVEQPFLNITSFTSETGAGFRLGKNYTLSSYFEGAIGNFHIWNRILSDGEAQAWTRNPFITLAPLARQLWVPSDAVVTWLGPDLTTTGWTSTAATFASEISEATADNATAITGPLLGTGSTLQPLKATLVTPYTAGFYLFGFRGHMRAGSGQVRFNFLDASNVSVGASAYQALTTTNALYAVSVTLSGTATQLQLETIHP